VLTDIEQTIQVTLNKHYRIRSGDLSSYRCACGAAPWLDSHLASELSKAVQPLHDAAKALVDKLDLCIPAINGQFVIAHIHGMDYKGPTFGVELEVLRAVLAAESDAKHSSPEPAAPASDAPPMERLSLIETFGCLLAAAELECGHKHSKTFATLSKLRDEELARRSAPKDAKP